MRYLKDAFKATFAQPRHIVTAVVACLVVMLAVLWVGSASTVDFIIKSPLFASGAKFHLVVEALVGGLAVFHPASLVLTLIVAILFGLNAALTAHYFRCKASLGAQAGTSLVGAIIAMLGVGCAACGSVALTAILGAGVTAGLVSILPFDGLEFSIVGIAVLLYSMHHTARKLAEPVVCPIK